MKQTAWMVIALICLAAPAAHAESGFSVEVHTLQFTRVSFDKLLVLESLVVEPVKAGGDPVPRFGVPAGAKGLQLGKLLERRGDELVATRPLTARTEYSFGYELAGDGKRVVIERRLERPVRQFFAYALEGTYQVEAEGLQLRRGVLDRQNGRTYVALVGRELPSGQVLRITFSTLKGGNPIGRLFVVLSGLIVVGFLALVAGLALDQRQQQATRRYLMGQLTALEEAHEADQVSQEFFKARRKELKELLER